MFRAERIPSAVSSNSPFTLRTLVVADGNSPEILSLAASAPAPVATVDQTLAPLQAITDAIGDAALDTLHLVAHGRPGAICIGGVWIDEAVLVSNAELLASWNVANVALWSCSAGATETFTAMLARLTGARVYATDSVLGLTDHGPAWTVRCGAASMSAPFAETTLQTWPHQLAFLGFVGAYEVTNTAGKESNSHTFDYAAPLGAASIDDNKASRLFSGNDVSAIGIDLGGQTYYGWISRPIKAQGEVVGFYMWTDADFTSLAAAEADGNQDADSNTSDNRGFILVVNQAYFDNLAATSGTIKTVGSSSDRVDSALNALQANVAPVAVADISNLNLAAGVSGGPAREAGATVTTVNAIGNVLNNDTDANVGDTKTVSNVGTASSGQTVNAATTSANGTVINGLYGTLTIGADGSYSYVVNNSNTAVQALRTAANTLSDVFTYTMKDATGAASTTSLTVKIQGANDAPVANADYNSAKESTTTLGSGFVYTGYSAQGNVLLNDRDVDANSEVLTVGGLAGSAAINSLTTTTPTSVLTFLGDSGFTSVGVGRGLFVLVGGTYRAVLNSSGTTVTITSKTEVSPGNYDIGLSATPVAYYNASGNVAIANVGTFFSANPSVGFKNDTSVTTTTTSSMKTATVSAAETSGTSTVSLSTITLDGVIAVGMLVTGTGVPADTHVTSITFDGAGKPSSIVLDQIITSTAGLTLSFTANAGQTLTGHHGTLVLNSNGSYVYTPYTDNSALGAGQTAVEEFEYTVTDVAGQSSTATLYITVYGSGTNDPVANADTASGINAAVEAGVAAGSNATGNVLTNDLEKAGAAGPVSASVAGARAADTAAETAVATNTAIVGIYGTLSLSSTGAYSYSPDNTNPLVNALASGGSLTETFYYSITNSLSGSGTAISTLTVTINGANDAPVAVSDTNVAQENGLDPSGDVLSNDTDVDTGDTRVVSAAQAGASSSFGAEDAVGSGTTSQTGLAIAGEYGTLIIGADGTYHYTVDNADAAVKALGPTSPALQDVFAYRVADALGAGATATLTIDVTGINDTPVNATPGSVRTGVNTGFAFTGIDAISVSDEDENLSSTSVSVENGTLTVSLAGGATISNGSSGSSTLTLEGTVAQINAALATLSYMPANGFAGIDYLTVYTDDDDGAFDNDIIAITVSDAKDLVVGTISGNTTEAGGAATFTVRLSAQPTHDVVVTVASDDAGEGTAAPATLTFTTLNWNTVQTVTVTGIDDTLIDGDIDYDIDLSAASTDPNFNGKTASVDVVNVDNDVASFVTSTISGNTTEAGGTATFTVKLSAQPTHDVVIAVASDDTSEGTASPATLTFTVANWNTAQSVTVTGADDSLIDGNVDYAIDLSATSTDANFNGKTGSVDVVNTDNDAASLVVSTISGNTTEAGGTATFTVKLSAQPDSDVTIAVASDDTTEGAAAPAMLTFTSANWNTNQTVTVSGADDALVDGNIDYDVDLTATSTDISFNGKTASVDVINTDDDGATLVVSTISANTTEAGGTGTFTVKLSAQPTQDVVISVASTDTTEGTVGPARLTFTSANWNIIQTVTVTGVADAVLDGNVDYDVALSAASADASFHGKTATVDVINVDVPPPSDPEPQPKPFGAVLDPATDNGASNQDKITSVINPQFTFTTSGIAAVGYTAILLDSDGNIVGSSLVTQNDMTTGQVNVTTRQLDDGTYIFTARILDEMGNVKGEAPVTVTIITDRDGVAPSIELAANGGDYNKDGVADWDQNNVAQLPLTSVVDFLAGKNAPASAFGAILVGAPALDNSGGSVVLNAGAQLLGVAVVEQPAPLPGFVTPASPMFKFSVTSMEGSVLQDESLATPGLQVRVVLDLPAGVKANSYAKWNSQTLTWAEFLDDQNLATYDEGATLLDINGDGLIDRVVLTFTDGGGGDEDGLVNGTIVDPGMLVFINSVSVDPPAATATPVYSILLANGDRVYTTNAGEAALVAKGTSNVFEGVRFDALEPIQGGKQFFANQNTITGDWYFAADGQSMPYLCYERVGTMAGFTAASAGSGPGNDYHLFMDSFGMTQLVTQAEAAQMALKGNGFADLGAIFNTTADSAFAFDAEGYLIANRHEASVQAFVLSLVNQYQRTTDAGFVEAVEQHYLGQIQIGLVGLAHGTEAGAAELNAAFNTAFAG